MIRYLLAILTTFTLAACGGGSAENNVKPSFSANSLLANLPQAVTGQTGTATGTSTTTTDQLYQFFAVAFNAAPGVTYMGQLNEAAGVGMTIKQIVNVFTTKTQFTDTYPTTLSNYDFAVKLINNVVGTSATDAAKTSAVNDVVAALALPGWTRGDVIFAIFSNLAAKPATDADWAGTSLQMKNQVVYAKYYTENIQGNTTDLGILRQVLVNVTDKTSTQSSQIDQQLTAVSCPTNYSLVNAKCIPSTGVVRGTVATGYIKNARIYIYNANTYINPTLSTPLASTTSSSDGTFSISLGGTFNAPIVLRAIGNDDGTTVANDEVYGPVSLDSSFILESVAPRSGISGGMVIANITPFTNAMKSLVEKKIGKQDINEAIVLAQTETKSKLTNGLDPLSISPTSVEMAVLLASVSNIAKATVSIPGLDPIGCSQKNLVVDKVKCTISTVASIFQPLTVEDPINAIPKLNYNQLSALKQATSGIDSSLVAKNTGYTVTSIDISKNNHYSALSKTMFALESAATSSIPDFLRIPDLWINMSMNGGAYYTDDNGIMKYYQGWQFGGSLCYVGTNCTSVGDSYGYTGEDLHDDPTLYDTVRDSVRQALTGINGVLHALRDGKIFPPEATIKSVIAKAISDGKAAQSVSAGVDSAKNGFAAAGYPVPGTSGTSSQASPAQLSAAQACVQDSAYQNSSGVPYDPQLDTNCRLAQVNACIHRDTGITTYDPQGRAACAIVKELLNQAGTWSCRYCPYPY